CPETGACCGDWTLRPCTLIHGIRPMPRIIHTVLCQPSPAGPITRQESPMSQPIIQSRCSVATTNGSRYLQQLCKHWAHKFEVEFDAERGRIAMPEDRVVILTATPQTLEIRLDA